MKLITVLLLITLSVHGQPKLNGTFLSQPDSIQGDLESSWITFQNDSLFQFVSQSCTYSKKGKGIYKLDGGKLTLHFIGNKMPKDKHGEKYPSSHYPIKDGIIYNYDIIKQSEDTLILRNEYNYTTVYLKLKK
jgi:hypothetical protein